MKKVFLCILAIIYVWLIIPHSFAQTPANVSFFAHGFVSGQYQAANMPPAKAVCQRLSNGAYILAVSFLTLDSAGESIIWRIQCSPLARDVAGAFAVGDGALSVVVAGSGAHGNWECTARQGSVAIQEFSANRLQVSMNIIAEGPAGQLRLDNVAIDVPIAFIR